MTDLPPDLTALLADQPMIRARAGHSGDTVLRVAVRDGAPAYLKVAQADRRAELCREGDVLRWLAGVAARYDTEAGARSGEGAGQVVAPDVLYAGDDGERHYLLFGEVPGPTLLELRASESPEALAVAWARALRRLHALPTGACAFGRPLHVLMAEARERARRGLVDLDDLDESRRGWSVERLLEALEATMPADEDVAFTHGDCCLDNVVVRDDGVVGFVDWGRAGVADRYRDIALVLRDLEDVAARVEPLFCREYGLAAIDREKVAFYQLLDEFF